ncbi:hypothetical protein FLT15_01140 [Paenibacillus thiaminolyticus]|uniref:hypothetical protein n=1 Tax=Paenibacillus thiaminolyticus TaxID=49283 RepID=UPI001164BB0D|nr:hypothetical protein [Paenibacillus thiaminolyticus]MDG0875199.1 hypothetical protein [Paenibacillus thiaminolyticus]NGP57023.1 hypothetical protein [Paenibacillus thiaminolyticus]
MKNETCFVFCILLNAVSGLMMLLWFPALFAGGMLFDAPNSHEYVGPYIVFFAILGYPVGLLASLTCWIAYHNRQFKAAYILAGIPGLWIVPAILIVVFVHIYGAFLSMTG